MKWFQTIVKLSVLLKVANFKANVKRIKRNSKIIFAVLFVVLTLVLLWFVRPFAREAVDDYRQEQRRAALPEAVTYERHSGGERSELIESPDSLGDPIAPASPPLQDDEVGEFPVAEVRTTTEENVLLTSYNLHIPFTPQAPHANWDMPYQEACEEASAYMVNLYFNGDKRDAIPPDEADERILELVAWQNQHFGYYKDTTVEEVVEMLRLFYNLRGRVIDNPSVEQIKEATAQGYPVIVPAYGKDLPNPNFRNGGPLYHMLVIKGYTESGRFITNDPGTRRGAEFTYKYNEVMGAIHDWNDGDVPNGAARVIVVEGPIE